MLGKTTTISLAIGILLAVGWMAYMSENMLREPTKLLRSFKVDRAPAADGGSGSEKSAQSQPAAACSAPTTIWAGKIRRGMSRSEVESILGLPAIVTTRDESRGDGEPVRVQSAIWLKPLEKITVVFSNGMVQSVVSVPLPGPRPAEAPTPEAEKPRETEPRKQTPRDESDEATIPKDLSEKIRKLEKQLRENHDPDNVFKQVFEATKERK